MVADVSVRERLYKMETALRLQLGLRADVVVSQMLPAVVASFNFELHSAVRVLHPAPRSTHFQTTHTYTRLALAALLLTGAADCGAAAGPIIGGVRTSGTACAGPRAQARVPFRAIMRAPAPGPVGIDRLPRATGEPADDR